MSEKCKCDSWTAEVCHVHNAIVVNPRFILRTGIWELKKWVGDWRWWLGKKMMGVRWWAMCAVCPKCKHTFALHPVSAQPAEEKP